MKRAVILAAGDGGRLESHTESLPKALVPVAGRPLIQYTLEALAESGVEEAVVVTGHREEQLRAALREGGTRVRVRFASNPDFYRGASLSLRAARDWTGRSPFLLLMADHLFSADLLTQLSAASRAGVSTVAADFAPEAHHDVAEATRLRADRRSGAVTAIGKLVAPYDALDAGAFALDPTAWEGVDAAPVDCELSIIFGELVKRGTLWAADVSGCFWFDVDTSAELAAANELMREQRRGVA